MAPVVDLLKRQSRCPSGQYYRNGYCYSSWAWYGRWIFAAVVIAVIIIILTASSCIRSRRQRRRGVQPMYGMGWMAPPQNYNNAAPPAYGAQNQSYPMNNQPQYTGNTFNTNDGYYGHHEGIAPPKNVYTNDNRNETYAPPEGPPPGKTIR
ncbi:chitin synthesis regulation, resistance to congo red-domain-containing protein [Pseudomassariella vexata]|uniref:Chitin synthesis regulation, resistance to congo red-domain-containing protein n=1 Tax=Pseudomassariella vexata TaxID=1141098 RepID=A0A1Y2E3S1_9PEZI|nr:chitin synthesis regulation, resistance to congo red-domain-containing protein [Pseudomassariella vexata]ORY65946.1 chitin synthesis regulation, resistance to congo red-domain-containing protein [Pseudomassariella vexata]